MKPKEFLDLLVTDRTRTNHFVLCPDNLGLLTLIPATLRKKATAEDIHVFEAAAITVEKARQIEAEARKGPLAGSPYTYFFLHGLQHIPQQSVGPLLKAVEEAPYAIFIFQAQVRSKRTRTLMSRSQVVQLPFLSKRVVLQNMRLRQLDADTADEKKLWDGTLDGTITALGMKDTLVEIRREVRAGPRGIAAMLTIDEKGNHSLLNSNAFLPALEEKMTVEEREFLRRNSSIDRKKLVLYRIMQRQGRS